MKASKSLVGLKIPLKTTKSGERKKEGGQNVRR
jgi:hypothetical protein